MNSDGRNLVQLTQTPLDERAPSISPDGEKIAYATSDGALWILTLSSRETSKLPLPEGRYNHPSWSPDGKSIVYTSYRFSKEGEDADLWVYSLEEKKAGQLLTQTGVQDHPVFSPDGEGLLYSSSGTVRLSGSGFTVIQQLWLASLREGRVKQILLSNARDTEPAWSADGNRIVFSSDRAGNADLWIMAPDGTNLVQLTEGPAAELHPTWSPDGREIAFVSTESGEMQLLVAEVSNRTMRKLNPFPGEKVDMKDPDWR
jgi:TolB protein